MKPRTLIVLLCASLGVNVFLAGAIAGGWAMRQRAVAAAPSALRGGMLRQAGAALSPESRAVFRRSVRAEAGAIGPLALEARRSRLEAADLIAAPTFDRVAADAALDRARARDFEIRTRLEHATMGAISELKAPERAALGEAMRRRAMLGRAGRGPPPAGNP